MLSGKMQWLTYYWLVTLFSRGPFQWAHQPCWIKRVMINKISSIWQVLKALQKQIAIILRKFLDRVNWCKKTNPKCWATVSPGLGSWTRQEGDSKIKARIHDSLKVQCIQQPPAPTAMTSLPQWSASLNWGRVNHSFPKLLLWDAL